MGLHMSVASQSSSSTTHPPEPSANIGSQSGCVQRPDANGCIRIVSLPLAGISEGLTPAVPPDGAVSMMKPIAPIISCLSCGMHWKSLWLNLLKYCKSSAVAPPITIRIREKTELASWQRGSSTLDASSFVNRALKTNELKSRNPVPLRENLMTLTPFGE